MIIKIDRTILPTVLLKSDTDADIIRFADEFDLPYVVDLSKKENHALGFIPKMAYESAITGIKTGKRWSDICNDTI